MLRALLTPLFASVLAVVASAQSGTIVGATIDVTTVPQGQDPRTITLVGGEATGTPFADGQLTFRPTDVVTFDNAAVLTEESGGCDVDGVEVEATVAVDVPTIFGGIRIEVFSSPVQELTFSGACPLPSTAPQNLPACGPGRELFVSPNQGLVTLDPPESPRGRPAGGRGPGDRAPARPNR